MNYQTNYFEEKEDNQIIITSPPKKKNFSFNTSSSNIENYILSLAKSIKKKIDDFREFNPLKEIKPEELMELNEQTYEAIYYILSKSLRQNYELLIIKIYLKTLHQFINSLKIEQELDHLLFSIAIALKCEKKKENTIVYRYGDKGKKCYILLIGNLSVLLPKENKIKCSYLVYFKHLILLHLYNEKELLKKTILRNKNIYTFDEEEIDKKLHYLKKSIEKNIPIEQINLFNFNQNEIKDIVDYFIKIEEIIVNKNIKQNCSVKDYIKYTFLYDNEDCNANKKEELVIIYSYVEIIKKGKGDIIDVEALYNIDNKRNETIICINNCVFATLSRDIYNKCFKDVEYRKRKNNIKFIHTFPIFKKIKSDIFEVKFFNLFKSETIRHGQTIIKQGKNGNKVYFIKEGQFQINSLISLNEMTELLKEKRKLIFKPKNTYSANERKLYKLSIINDNEVIGLKDVRFNSLYIIDVICVSTNGLVFYISDNDLEDISLKFPEVKTQLESLIKFKEKIITNRFLEIYKNSEKTHTEEIKRTNIEKKNFTSKRKEIFKEVLKNQVLGKKNRVKSSKTRVNFSETSKSPINTKKIEINNNRYNENIKLSKNNLDKKKKLRVVSALNDRRNFFTLNTAQETTFGRYMKTTNDFFKSHNSKSINIENPFIKYNINVLKKEGFNKYLKSIIGNEYEEQKLSFKEAQFRKFLVDNKKKIIGKCYNEESPTVDLLYYEKNIIENKFDKRKKKKKKRNKHSNNASSSLLNFTNFNKNNIIKFNSTEIGRINNNILYNIERGKSVNTIDYY